MVWLGQRLLTLTPRLVWTTYLLLLAVVVILIYCSRNDVGPSSPSFVQPGRPSDRAVPPRSLRHASADISVNADISANANLTLAAYSFSDEPRLEDILEFCRRRHPDPESVDDVQMVIDVYLEERAKGLSADRVTKQVFKIHLPHHNEPYNHPHSYPFVAGDTFRAFADFVMDNVGDIYRWKKDRLDEHMVDGDVLFVKPDFMATFIKELLPSISHKFILISHNSDYSMPARVKASEKILKSKYLIKWFAKNASKKHPKLESLPIGIMSRRFAGPGLMTSMEQSLRSGVPPIYEPGENENNLRPNLVYVNFSPGSNKEYRPKAIETFKEIGTRGIKVTLEKYFDDMKHSKYMLSPPGSGEDCYRTWEALIFNTIPIVRNSFLWPLYKDLPVYILDDWNHVEAEQFLNFQVKTKERRTILAQYWFDKINSYRENLW